MKKSKFEAVILGSGIIRNKNGYEPCPNGKLRARAGAYLFLQGKASRLIFTGGKVLGVKHPSVASVMIEYIKRKFDIPEKAVSLEEDAMDTVHEIERIGELKKGTRDFLVISNKFHLPRIRLIAKRLKISLEILACEDILLQIPNEKKEAKEFLSSTICKKQQEMEKQKVRQLKERLETNIPHRWLDSQGRIKSLF